MKRIIATAVLATILAVSMGCRNTDVESCAGDTDWGGVRAAPEEHVEEAHGEGQEL